MREKMKFVTVLQKSQLPAGLELPFLDDFDGEAVVVFEEPGGSIVAFSYTEKDVAGGLTLLARENQLVL